MRTRHKKAIVSPDNTILGYNMLIGIYIPNKCAFAVTTANKEKELQVVVSSVVIEAHNNRI